MIFLKIKNSSDFYISTGTPQTKIIKILKKKKKNYEIFLKKCMDHLDLKLIILKKLKKNYNKIIFIGDSFEDFKAAKRTGVKFILKLNSENYLLRKKTQFRKNKFF